MEGYVACTVPGANFPEAELSNLVWMELQSPLFGNVEFPCIPLKEIPPESEIKCIVGESMKFYPRQSLIGIDEQVTGAYMDGYMPGSMRKKNGWMREFGIGTDNSAILIFQ